MTIGLVAANGFTINLAPGEQIPITQFYQNATIGLGNGTLDNPPVFRVCDENLVCSESRAPDRGVFTTKGVPWEWIVVGAVGAAVGGTIVGIVCYVKRPPTKEGWKPQPAQPKIPARSSQDQYIKPEQQFIPKDLEQHEPN